MNSKRTLYIIIGALFLCVGLYKGYGAATKTIKRSKGFSLEKISSKKEYQVQKLKEVAPAQLEKANALLNQPFFFLGKGRQCFAFISSDGQYVLKFFQQERFQVAKDYLTILPDSFLAKRLRKRKAKLKAYKRERALFSFELAKEYAEEETGVFFVHLTPTKGLHESVTVLDKKGKVFSIPLDNVQFALQKRARLVKPTLMALMHEKKIDEAKARIEQIFTLLVSCAKKGVGDSDGALIRNDNLGFLEDRAIYIDIGKLYATPKVVSKEAFAHDLRRLRPLQHWLEKHYPKLASHFASCQEKAVGEFHD